MRVERFSLFFGPLVLKRRVGETEYGIGVIPLGGYAKISGMSPEEDSLRSSAPRLLQPGGLEADRRRRGRSGRQPRRRVRDRLVHLSAGRRL